MIAVLGADGHVGSATSKALIRKGEPTLVVLHSDKKEKQWKKLGADTAIADVNDADTLRNIFKQCEKVFLLNPPAAPDTDTVSLEKQSVASIMQALKGSGIRKIVAESTYGAQQGDGIGDLGVLYEMEQALEKLNIPTIIIRPAYYMSNWDASLETARNEGIVHTLYPIDFTLPMVAPEDIGEFAAQFLTESFLNTGMQFVEGPQQYSSADVAAAFSTALNKPVKALETPPEEWLSALQQMEFSEIAAQSMAAITKLTLDAKFELVQPNRGSTTLENYIHNLLKKS